MVLGRVSSALEGFSQEVAGDFWGFQGRVSGLLRGILGAMDVPGVRRSRGFQGRSKGVPGVFRDLSGCCRAAVQGISGVLQVFFYLY